MAHKLCLPNETDKTKATDTLTLNQNRHGYKKTDQKKFCIRHERRTT